MSEEFESSAFAVQRGAGMELARKVTQDNPEAALGFALELGKLLSKYCGEEADPQCRMPAVDGLVLMAVAQGFAIGHDICKGEHFEKMVEASIMMVSVMLDNAAEAQDFQCQCCGDTKHSIN
jgi:hypothetical protein